MDEDLEASFSRIMGGPSRARATAVGNAVANPEQAGEAQRLSRETGAPAEVINEDFSGFKTTLQQRKTESAMQRPSILEYVENNPMASQVSNDDWDALHKLGRVAKLFGTTPFTDYLPESFKQSRLVQQGQEHFTDPAINAAKGVAAAWDEYDPATQGTLPSTLTVGKALGQSLLSTVSLPFMPAISIVGKPIGHGLADAEHLIGGYLNPEVAARDDLEKMYVQSRHDAEMALSVIGGGLRHGKRMPGLSTPEEIETFLSIVKGRATREEIDAFLRSKAAQEPVSGPLALPSPETIPAGTGVHPVVDTLHIERAKFDAAGVDKLVELADAAKTKERSPELLSKYLEPITGGRTVGIPVEAIEPLYRASAPEAGDGILGFVPDLARQIEVAKVTGGDVVVSLADYLAWVPKELHTKLAPNLRLREEGVTLEESKELQKEVDKNIEESKDLHKKMLEFSNERTQTAETQIAELEKSRQKNIEFGSQEYDKARMKAEEARVKPYNDAELSPFMSKEGIATFKIEQETSNKIKKLQTEANYERVLQVLPPGFTAKRAVYTHDFGGKGWTDLIGKYEDHNIEIFNAEGGLVGSLDGLSLHSGWFKDFLKNPNPETVHEGALKAARSAGGIPEGVTDLNFEKVRKELEDIADQLDKATRTKKSGEIVQLKSSDAAEPGTQAAANATADATVAEKQALYLTPLFKDAKAAGMTEAAFKAYSRKIERSQTEADEAAVASAEKEVRRRQTAEWKKAEAEISDEVKTDLRFDPTHLADRYFRTGDVPGGIIEKGLKIAESDAVGIDLPKGVVAKGGVPADDLAPIFGFNSGKELLQSLSELNRVRGDESPAQFAAKLQKAEIQARMEQRFGALDRNIYNEAREVALADVQFDLLADELKALALQIKGARPVITKDELVEHMARIIANESLENALRYESFVRQAGSAGKKAEMALLEGDFEEAFVEKQRQFVSMLQAKQAKEIGRIKEKTDKLFNKYQTSLTLTNVDQAFTNQIQALLQSLGYFVNRNPENIGKSVSGISLNDFLAERKAEGDIVVPNNVPNKPISEFTVNDYLALRDTVMNLDKLGREEKLIEVAGKKEDRFQTIDKIAKSLDTLEKSNFDPTKPGVLAKTGAWIRWADAKLVKVEQLSDWIDRNDPLGIFNQTVFRPMIEAEHAKLDFTEKLAKVAAKLPGDRQWGRDLGKKIDNQILLDEFGDPVKMTNENKITIALNFGNESNKSVLLRGHGWNEADVQSFLNEHMTKQDWDFVSAVWKMVNELGPLVEKATSQRSGVPIDLVNPTSVSTKFGTIEGGYYPLIRDPRDALLGKQRKTDLVEKPFFDPLPMARAMHMRTGIAYPLDLTIGALHSRINETIHAVFMQEPVMNANKVISDSIVRQGVDKAFGPEYVRELDNWLKDIANNGGAFNDAWASWLSRNARENVVTMLMGWRASTALIHGGSAGMSSIYEAGMLPLLKAVKELGVAQTLPQTARRFFSNDANMMEALNEVYEKSSELRNRQRSLAKDFGHQVNLIVRKGYGDDLAALRAEHQAWAMSVVGFLDQLTAVPVWQAKYALHIREGMSEADAIYAADKAVRQAHGSASLVSRANIGRGEVNRWLTIAYNGYWNHNYNRNRDVIRTMENKGEEHTFSEKVFLGSAFLTALVIAPALIHYEVRGTGHEDIGLAIAEGLTAQFTGQVPIVSGLAYSLLHNIDPSISPVTNIMKSVSSVVHDVTAKRGGKKFVQHIAELPGYITGLGPTGQIAIGMQFGADVMKYRQAPDGPIQWARGLMTGSTQPKKVKR